MICTNHRLLGEIAAVVCGKVKAKGSNISLKYSREKVTCNSVHNGDNTPQTVMLCEVGTWHNQHVVCPWKPLNVEHLPEFSN